MADEEDRKHRAYRRTENGQTEEVKASAGYQEGSWDDPDHESNDDGPVVPKKAANPVERARKAAEANARLKEGFLSKNLHPHGYRWINVSGQARPVTESSQGQAPPSSQLGAVSQSTIKELHGQVGDLQKQREDTINEHNQLAAQARQMIVDHGVAQEKGIGVDPTYQSKIDRVKRQLQGHKAAVNDYNRRIAAKQKQVEYHTKVAASGDTNLTPYQRAATKLDFANFHKLQQHKLKLAAQGQSLHPNDEAKYWDLKGKTEQYHLVYDPDENGRFPDEEEQDRINRSIDHSTTHATGIRPKGEDFESLGAKQDGSWGQIHRFNKEQGRRRRQGLRSGEQPIINRGGLVVGANQEQVVNTTTWNPIDRETASQGHDTYHVQLGAEGRKEGFTDQGNYYMEGQNVEESLRQAGLSHISVRHTGNGLILHTDEGTHLNPDEQAYLQQTLHANHNLKSFKPEGTADYARVRYVQPINAARRLPTGVSDSDVAATSHRQAIFSNRGGVKFGERDPITGELGADQADTIGIRVGKFAPRFTMNEDTDRLGFKPGSKEVSQAVTALPRAARDQRIFEAYHSTNPDDQLGKIVDQEHPELETDGEREQEKSKLKHHAKELAGAGFASAYYSSKQNMPRRAASKAYAKAQGIETLGIGSKVQGFAKKTNLDSFAPTYRWGVQRPMGDFISRSRYRVRHPLGDPTDRSMAGITRSGNGLEMNLPSWHYRKFPIDQEEYAGRQEERKVSGLASAVNTRKSINTFLEGDSRNPVSRIQARSAAVDPERRLSDSLVGTIKSEHERLGNVLKSKTAHLGTKNMDWEDVPTYRAAVMKQHNQLSDMLSDIQEHPESFSHEGLKNAWSHYAETAVHTDSEWPTALKRGLGAGAGAAAIAGLAVYGVDKYQTHRQATGKEVSHHVVGPVADKGLKLPALHAYRTAEYTMPHNALTDFLDIEDKTYPVAGRVGVHMKSVVKPNLKSRMNLDMNAPLAGGLSFKTPKAPNYAGSGLVHEAPKAANTKNMYVAGRKVPVDVTLGQKERWGDKNHKLSAANPNKLLTPADRESLVRLSTTPEGVQTGNAGYYKNLYGHDKQFMRMVSDPDSIERAHANGPASKYISRMEDVTMKGSNEDLENFKENRRQQGRAMRESGEDMRRQDAGS